MTTWIKDLMPVSKKSFFSLLFIGPYVSIDASMKFPFIGLQIRRSNQNWRPQFPNFFQYKILVTFFLFKFFCCHFRLKTCSIRQQNCSSAQRHLSQKYSNWYFVTDKSFFLQHLCNLGLIFNLLF